MLLIILEQYIMLLLIIFLNSYFLLKLRRHIFVSPVSELKAKYAHSTLLLGCRRFEEKIKLYCKEDLVKIKILIYVASLNTENFFFALYL